MTEILQYLKKHGECLDAEIAEEMKLPLATVREGLMNLAASGLVVTCIVTRFTGAKQVDGWLCRASGYIPPAAPGRKPKLPPA